MRPLRAETEVVAARPSASRPGAGIVTFEHRGYNQRAELVAREREVLDLRRQTLALEVRACVRV